MTEEEAAFLSGKIEVWLRILRCALTGAFVIPVFGFLWALALPMSMNTLVGLLTACLMNLLLGVIAIWEHGRLSQQLKEFGLVAGTSTERNP